MHFWLTDADGNVLLRRRPPEGLLGGMTELPGTEWRARPVDADEALALAPMDVRWQPAGQVRHGFTHFELTIDLFAARVARIEADGFQRPVGSTGGRGTAVGDAQMRPHGGGLPIRKFRLKRVAARCRQRLAGSGPAAA